MAEEKAADTGWLDELFPDAKKNLAKQVEDGLVFSQKYLVFSGPTSDPRARELFEHWTRQIRRARVPKDAPLQELAAHNALREWIEGIHAQIEFANQGVNQPKPRTK